MACFIVPATEAIITTAAAHAVKKHETQTPAAEGVIRLSEKLGWLNKMLWGGSALLAFEHLWHGEITPFFPFLTNAATPESAAEMLHEMATSGVAMALLVTAVWAGIAVLTSKFQKREKAEEASS